QKQRAAHVSPARPLSRSIVRDGHWAKRIKRVLSSPRHEQPRKHEPNVQQPIEESHRTLHHASSTDSTPIRWRSNTYDCLYPTKTKTRTKTKTKGSSIHPIGAAGNTKERQKFPNPIPEIPSNSNLIF
uniref:Uncharacterized protein n=1 Tax=Aegilops tauschii subsp. strangulata TaxID=200361 RepID=A0A453KV92_AEGTS